ncbi:MAG: glycosyl hydrolase [Mycobacterium sp.]|nr:glycosyl hydrolase [Mycobacterium sp.]
MSDTTKFSGLTLEQKAALGSGADMWRSKSVGTIPAITLVDGPHGVRMPSAAASSNLDMSATEPATCFPPAVALAQTWDPALVERVGVALGEESRALGVDVLLGPGLNIKRDPRCGRNFEYFSEDPLLTGILGTAWVTGLQSTGVGASVKHFAANNAETDRMRVSSDVDPRTLREIYLRAFQRVIQQAHPWTVMCSYNRINGTYATENHWLLTNLLREEWGFDGVVVSDWGAVRNRVAAVAAGVDLEMPGGGGSSDADVVAAVAAEKLPRAALDRAAERMAALVAKAGRRRGQPAELDADGHHALAREVAGRAIVLLKNDDDLLPLRTGSIAVIGEFAQQPVYQGGGSSHVKPTRLDIPLEEIRRVGVDCEVTFAPGFTTDGAQSAQLREDAVRHARAADVAVVFLGLSDQEESEGWDRSHLDLPEAQVELLRAVARVQPRTVAVLTHGGAVRSGVVAESAAAVLDGAVLGQAGGGAIADVLFGRVNPAGRLAETVPLRLEDVPSFLNFPGESGHVLYGERIFVGYRGYDVAGTDVAFPFGHGLSYTRFDYSDLVVDTSGDQVVVRVSISNVGQRPGREVVQVYAGATSSAVSRAPRWLVGFGNVHLEPGETTTCEITFAAEELAYWHNEGGTWVIEGGDYVISVGSSSRDLRLTTTVAVDGDEPPTVLSLQSTFEEVLADPKAGPAMLAAFAEFAGDAADSMSDPDALGGGLRKMMGQIPIERVISFSGGKVSRDDLERLLRSAR